MTPKLLYQYARRDDAVQLRARSFFDNDTGKKLKGVVPYSDPPESGTIGVFGDEDGWRSIQIAVQMQIDPALLKELLPNPAKFKSVTSALVAVESPAVKYRRGYPLAWRSDGTWEGNVELRRSDLEGEVLLTPYLARSREEAAVDGYGCFSGAILASGSPVRLMLQEPPPATSTDFDYRWVKFADASDFVWLQQRRDDPFFLDSARPKPKLFLNRGIQGFKPVLDSKARTGINMALRNAFRATVIQSVYFQLLATAVACIRDTGDREYEVLGPLWAAPTARWAAGQLFSDLPLEEQLGALYLAFQDPSQVSYLLGRLQSIANDSSGIGADFESAARALELDQNGDDEDEAE